MVDTERSPGHTAQGPLSLSGGTREGASESLAEAVKPVGALMTSDHRYYWNGLGPYPSVTTALKVIDKPAVTAWVARETAKAALRNLQELEQKVKEAGQDEAVAFLLAQPRDTRDAAANLGSSVHLLADMEARPETAGTGFQVSDEAQPYLAGFRGFLAYLKSRGGQILSSEHAVFNVSDGYAGTYDLILEYRDAVWLVDIKTSKGYYPEFALQLAAYGRGQWIGLEGDPTQYPMPHIDRYAVLHLRPDQYQDTGWRLVEYPVTGRDYVAFLAALDLWQWKAEGRFTKSILQKAIDKGDLTGIRSDPLTQESSIQE